MAPAPSPNDLSFLPDDYLERKAQRRSNVICASLFVIVMAGIGSAFMLTERMTHDLEKQHSSIDSAYAEAAKRIEQVKQMQTKQQQIAAKAEISASLLEKIPRSFLLAELTNALPETVSLLDLELDSKVATPPPAAPPPGRTAAEAKKAQLDAKKATAAAPPPATPKAYNVTVKLTGVAGTDVQVAQYMKKLGDSPLLRDINLIIIEDLNRDEQTIRKFQIEMGLDPRAAVTPEQAARAVGEMRRSRSASVNPNE